MGMQKQSWASVMAVVVTTMTGGFAMANDATGRVTFTKDVLPILQENCQVCHRAGGANLGGMIAPMAFTSYAEVRPWAKAIAKAVEAKDMPPWDASPEFHGVFKNERTITDEEIATIVKWANTGAVRGNLKDAPEPIEFPDTGGWQIGTPDLIVEMPEAYFVEDDVEDLYVNFVDELTDEQLPEDRFVKAVEFRPGSTAVHHIISNPLGGIAPGNDPTVFEDNYYQVLTKGAEVSFEMHYHKEPGPGTGVWDQSSAAIKFYPKDAKPEHQIRMALMGHQNFAIPAGDSNYEASYHESFPQDIEILSFTPHMHLRGKSASYSLEQPDGTMKPLLDVPGYDFNWQTNYEYAEHPIIKAGTNIHVTMAWDNSADNPYNPDATREVTFGEPTTDEMMFGFMRYAYLEEPKALKLSVEELSEYVGTYAFSETDEMNFVLKGTTLMGKSTNSPTFPLTPDSKDRFVFAMVNLVVEFERNDAGELTAMAITFQDDVDRAIKVHK